MTEPIVSVDFLISTSIWGGVSWWRARGLQWERWYLSQALHYGFQRGEYEKRSNLRITLETAKLYCWHMTTSWWGFNISTRHRHQPQQLLATNASSGNLAEHHHARIEPSSSEFHDSSRRGAKTCFEMFWFSHSWVPLAATVPHFLKFPLYLQTLRKFID